MIEIDGAAGEGGGQILRTALALSALTGKPFEMFRIRANRPRPGLRPQHLESVKAAARVCSGRVEGAAEESDRLRFIPGSLRPGRHRFEIRTAGSACLLLQTIYLPLAFARGESRVEIRGGTHVPWSPCFDYLRLQWAPWLARAGVSVSLRMKRAGFYPLGGGEMQAEIEPVGAIRPIRCVNRGRLVALKVFSIVANLPDHVADRQAERVCHRLERRGYKVATEFGRVESPGRGSFVAVTATFEDGAACYTALGARGKPAEKVGDEAGRAMEAFLESEAVMDEYLADQILLPLSLAPGESEYTTPAVTGHLTTNADVIRRFLGAEIEIEGEQGEPGRVRVRGRADHLGDSPAAPC